MSNAIEQGAVPIPPRYWWLKRIGIAAGTLIVLLVAVRIWWGYEADRRMRAAIARAYDAGGPVTIAEIDAQLAAVDDEENAALLYEEAFTQLGSVASDGTDVSSFLSEDRSFTDDAEIARELYEKNATALALVRRARERSQVSWSFTLSDILAQQWGLPYSSQRQLARVVAFAAAFEYETGDARSAIATTRDSLRFGEAVSASPTIISSLVSVGCQGLSCYVVEDHSLHLARVDDRQAGLVREGINLLIADLLDVERFRQSFAQARLSERAFQIYHWESGTLLGFGGIRGRTVAPAGVADAARALDLEWRLAGLAESDRYPRAHELLTSLDSKPSSVDFVSSPLLRHYNHVPRLFAIIHGIIAQRRMAAVALAIRLYQMDREAVPDTLNALVPDYLESVPEDPFAASPVPLIYAPDREEPVIYSVGENGIDDGGEPPFEGLDCGWQCDLVFYLNGDPDRRRRREAASAQAVDDDAAPENQNGNNAEDQSPKQ